MQPNKKSKYKLYYHYNMGLKMKNVDEFWSEFLVKTNKDCSIKYTDCFHFHSTKEWVDKLLKLVLSGQKQATTSSLYAYETEGNKIPQVGDCSIVTDWEGNPNCVIETTSVIILPFNEITYDICKREGEDDNLDSWREGHTKFFINEGQELGYSFSECMPVVFEDFKVVFIK